MLEINENAPVVAEASRRIDAPPSAVFAALSDIASWPRWQEDVTQMTVDGAPEIGTSFVWRARGSKISSRIEDFDPERSIGWRGRALGVSALHAWRLTADGDGTI